MVSMFVEQNHQSGRDCDGHLADGSLLSDAANARRQPKPWIGPMSNCAV